MAEMWKNALNNTQWDSEIDNFPESCHTLLDDFEKYCCNLRRIYQEYVYWSFIGIGEDYKHVDNIQRGDLQDDPTTCREMRDKIDWCRRHVMNDHSTNVDTYTASMLYNFVHVRRNQYLIELYSLLPRDIDIAVPGTIELASTTEHFNATIGVLLVKRHKDLLQKIHKSQLKFLERT
jgi:hypothetical protein